ncbi:MAG TPA: zf-TFIIB domain-containing protein [Polyangiaceae bacterium]|nr:zf-TFIIB domain-containing protein [Polyangiaceae bacterium]
MKCPRDGSVLETKTYEAKIEVDVCPSCGGMWLDHGELEAIQEAKEHDYRKSLEEVADTVSRSINQVVQETTAPIACVKCGTRMDTREYAYCSQIVIDTCPEGHGMWLDAGEIQALEKFFERSQAEAREALPLRFRLWATLYDLFEPAKKRR